MTTSKIIKTYQSYTVMSYYKKILLVLFTTFLIQEGVSQSKMKFGKIDMADLKMTRYDKDTSASAVVLGDYGKSEIVYNTTKNSFELIFERHRRIKILKKDGYAWADHAVSLYRNNSAKEKISSLKGYSYNLVNGKVEKSKLEKSSVFEEKQSEHHNKKKFTMPNVKVGTVIEYSYKIISDFTFNLQSWQFQTTIPTIWSEYKTSIPEYFNYKQLSQGYIPFDINERSSTTGSIILSGKSRSGGGLRNGSVRTSFATNKIDYRKNIQRWAAKDVAAFESEDFMTTYQDFISKIEFELASTKMPYGAYNPVMDTWETLTKKLLTAERFGLQLKKHGFIKATVETIKSTNTTPETQIQAIFNHVKSKMKWNGDYSKYITTTLKKAYQEGSGSSGDINLLLVNMLTQAGFDASPIILSTRNHGRINKIYPILSKFNYVIAHVKIKDKDYLLDATEPFLPINTLPFNCQNGEGYLINKTSSKWIALRHNEKQSHFTQVNLTFSDDLEVTGTISNSYAGYEALDIRNELKELGKEDYIKEVKESNEELDISNYEISNIKVLTESVREKYEITLEDYIVDAGNLIYIDPLLNAKTNENPFKLEKRAYPVDFGCPMNETYMITFDIPKGYVVEEVPKNTLVKLSNNGGLFKYVISIMNDKVTVVSTIKINQTMFLAEEYEYIKAFFEHIVTKQAEKIILKQS